jgi:UDP-N-acetylglucosamine--N-acetylmuramyl-(pentapeptide) pyrophosphoryl-undecaprenol N-acetylglucosamine transferase
VPAAGYEIEWIEIGGLNRVGAAQALRSLARLGPASWKSRKVLRARRAAAVFSMGGYVAAPVMLAALWSGVPIVAMEPNAMPGLVMRRMAGRLARALISFPETAGYFPAGRTELTGLPVREAFFRLPERQASGPLSVLVTGGSRGARTLNRAARESWPLIRAAGLPVRMTLQCGPEEREALAAGFAATGLPGEVVSFIEDMPAAYAAADLIVSRSGAGAVSELCAAGKPSVLVPFPFAADDHQRHNAEALGRAGAALVVADAEMNGAALVGQLERLAARPEELSRMGRAARAMARPGAGARAAGILEEVARRN